MPTKNYDSLIHKYYYKLYQNTEMTFDHSQEESDIYEKYYLPCARCGTTKNLSQHHIKDNNGKKTGKIEVLCRDCHNIAELEYVEAGIIILNEPAQKFGVLHQKPHKAKNDDHYYQIYQMRNTRDRRKFELKMAITNRVKKIKKHNCKCFRVLHYLETIKRYEHQLDLIIYPKM